MILALAVAGCTGVRGRTTVVTPGAAGGENAFPQIRARTDRVLKGHEGEVALRVHFASGEAAVAEHVLEELREPVRFLEERTGLPISGRVFGGEVLVRIYLAPLPADGVIPYHEVQGRDFMAAVLFFGPEGDLGELGYNRLMLAHVYPHELSHLVLLDRMDLGDRWLHDGIPDYLAGEFTRSRAQELYRSLRADDPPAVALDRARLEPWPKDSHENKAPDPELFALQAELGGRQYRAAEELVRRWMDKARANGVEEPLRDLIDRLQHVGRPVTWELMKELALEQTGQSLEEIATVSPAEKEQARREAWSDRTAGEHARRLWALQVLRHWGIPADTDPRGLLDAIEGADGRSALTEDGRLIRAAGGAIATAGDPAVARRLVERITESGRDVSLPPELWNVYTEIDRAEALRRLVETVQADDVPLVRKVRANEILEDLTGQSARWAADLSPEEREKAAARWEGLIGSKP